MENTKDTQQVTEEVTNTNKSEQPDSTSNIVTEKEKSSTTTQEQTHGDNIIKMDSSARSCIDGIVARESTFHTGRIEHYSTQGDALELGRDHLSQSNNGTKITNVVLSQITGISKSNISKYISISKSIEIQNLIKDPENSSTKLLQRLNIDKLAKLAKKEGDEFDALLKELANPPKKENTPSASTKPTIYFDKVDDTLNALESAISAEASTDDLLQTFKELQAEVHNLRQAIGA